MVGAVTDRWIDSGLLGYPGVGFGAGRGGRLERGPAQAAQVGPAPKDAPLRGDVRYCGLGATTTIGRRVTTMVRAEPMMQSSDIDEGKVVSL